MEDFGTLTDNEILVLLGKKAVDDEKESQQGRSTALTLVGVFVAILSIVIIIAALFWL